MQVKLNSIVAAAIALSAGAAFADDITVRIGHVGPVSGSQAHYGKDNENGARMAIEDLNKQNVMIGGKHAHFELVAEDDGAVPDPVEEPPAEPTAPAPVVDAGPVVDTGPVGRPGPALPGTATPKMSKSKKQRLRKQKRKLAATAATKS